MHTTVNRRFRLRIKRRAPSTRIRIVDGRAWARNAAHSATTQDAHQRSFGTIGILAAAKRFAEPLRGDNGYRRQARSLIQKSDRFVRAFAGAICYI